MAVTGVLEFGNDDEAYLRWITQNPEGYVINTPRFKPSNYMILHRSYCPSISIYSGKIQPGGFTERDYIKICSTDLDSLRNWVRQHGRPTGNFSSECGMCHQLDDWDFFDD